MYLRNILIFAYLILLYLRIDRGYYEIGICTAGIFLLFLPNILKRFRVYMSDSAILLFFTFLFLGVLGETVSVQYFWYDKLMHLASGFVYFTAGMVLLIIRYGENKVSYHYDNALVYSYIFCMFILISWEVFEATCDVTFGTNLLQTGLEDTLWDLVCDFLGATFAAILFFWHFKRKQIKLFSFLSKDLFKRRL